MSRGESVLADVVMDPDHWRGRGERTRVVAQAMTDPAAKAMMTAIAGGYEVLAERLEERARQRALIGGKMV